MGFEPVVVRWPRLRLARLRLERVSVVVVSPRFSRNFYDVEEDEVKTLGRAIGLDVHLEFCEVAIVEAGVVRSAGRIQTTPEELELFARSLGREDRVALEVCGSAWEIARILERHVARVIVVSPNDTGIRQARAKPAGSMRGRWRGCCGPVSLMRSGRPTSRPGCCAAAWRAGSSWCGPARAPRTRSARC
jgi:hypothetical protein